MIAITPKHEVSYDGAVLNIFHANAGEGLPRHAHAYAHLTTCLAGKCAVRKEGIEVIMDKHTQPINLTAGEWHEIEALETATVFMNVFAEGKQI